MTRTALQARMRGIADMCQMYITSEDDKPCSLMTLSAESGLPAREIAKIRKLRIGETWSDGHAGATVTRVADRAVQL